MTTKQLNQHVLLGNIYLTLRTGTAKEKKSLLRVITRLGGPKAKKIFLANLKSQ